MKTLYFDLSMGAAGDMLAAALFQLVPEPERVLAQVKGLGLSGVEARLVPAEKCGIQGLPYEVLVHGREEQEYSVFGSERVICRTCCALNICHPVIMNPT